MNTSILFTSLKKFLECQKKNKQLTYEIYEINSDQRSKWIYSYFTQEHEHILEKNQWQLQKKNKKKEKEKNVDAEI